MKKKQQEFGGTFFQKIEVDGKPITAKEAKKEGIYSRKCLIPDNAVVNKSLTIREEYRGPTFTNIEDVLAYMNAKNKPDNESDTDSESTCTPTG